ncbi:hypothetical protein A3F03_02295 [Candidatus Roizmanbacteria bacterium RIFCSPHIGHO2_12_FULL_41_11]|uniref:Enolase n=1 Tax=Candidatus Roizmanbacteria bacterium RIFCSPHIGHO2_12_FULL_41_11 TaxID=1802052 RepID=A0A1F7I4V3_9BACT|nr:MAG: hypothetical protein A3F03_02295 [Candidatus Roizmanbacteria bacterium RIFCSPHIGHO2_12_FULL_41_11]
MSMKISDVKAIEILDSRGKPTIRTFIKLKDGSTYSSSVPSGASTGKHEAVELRDGDAKRHQGQGVLKAVKNVNKIIRPAVIGLEVADIAKIDRKLLKLDGTDNKRKLGANAILSVSQAVTRAAAASGNLPLWKFINQLFFNKKKPRFPRLMVNVINGGKHANWNFDIQEFMIVPTSNVPSQALQVAADIFQRLGNNLRKQKLSTLVGDEGGYSPVLPSNEQVLDEILTAAINCRFQNGNQFEFALDCAASEFYDKGRYILQKTGQRLTDDELRRYYLKLQKTYHIISFEDPFAEDDWENFQKLTSDAERCRQITLHGPKIFKKGRDPKTAQDQFIVVGDDLYVTNPKRIKKGIDLKASSAVLIKLNQIGTVTETIDAIKMTQRAGWKTIISHRSGETEDPFIADLAYGAGADFIKTGSVCRSERLAKYNRLIEIENKL